MQLRALLRAHFLRLDGRRRIGLARRVRRRRGLARAEDRGDRDEREGRGGAAEQGIHGRFRRGRASVRRRGRARRVDADACAWCGPARGRRAGRTRRRCLRRGSCGSSSRSRRRSAPSGTRRSARAGSSRTRRPGNGFQGIRLNLQGTSRTSRASSRACSGESLTPSSITYSNVTKLRGARSR